MGATFGLVSKTIFGARIDMNWLRRNFDGHDKDSTKVQGEQHARVYIFMVIGGLLMPDKSRNLVHIRWLLKLITLEKWANSARVQPCWRRCTGRYVG
ncbi:hypothetical protein J1N35_014619 [Gossypium stocksii]|uniref:Uncharacterized protein n=1 Tax=Gossypium stocksii TaxID=47602 RepID=A0A9D4A7V5_9ROSI|nr:hypothetical protein J1N35_014619 [Gossypium stocksii]